MKKQKRNEGDFIKIKLTDEHFCFARVLKEPLIAFYDIKTNTDISLDEISTLPIVFKIWVMNNAITTNRWQVIGHKELEDELKKPAIFFKQDPISKSVFLYSDSIETPAVYEQCVGLERAAVWSPEHVEDRLLDHFDGKTNKWVDSLKLKPVS